MSLLINGQAITDHTTYGAPVAVHSSTVERTDAVRSASSVISGQRAVCGTIKIITKGGRDEGFEASGSLRYFEATEGKRFSNSSSGQLGGFTSQTNQNKADLGSGLVLVS